MVGRLLSFIMVGCFALGPAVWAAAAEGDASRQLIEAARTGDVGGVRRLLAAGTDPNATQGLPPLRAAVVVPRRAEHLEVMRLLLAAGADVNGRAPSGETALLRAAGLLDREAVRLLLEAGADPNLVDKQGVSPLLISLSFSYAEEDRHLEIVRLLLARGADVNIASTGPWGPTPLFEAVRRSRAGMRLMLLLLARQGAGPRAPSWRRSTRGRGGRA